MVFQLLRQPRLTQSQITNHISLLTVYCSLPYAIPFRSTIKLSGVIGKSLTRVAVAL